MPDDKPQEQFDRTEETESTRLNDAGNDDVRPAEKQAENSGPKLEKEGLLPGAKLEVAPGVEVGDKVNHSHEAWEAKGKHDGKSMLYQEGRGQNFAGEFKLIEGKPDPQKYKELPQFEGQPKNTKYYADQTGRVFKVTEGGDGKALMSTAHDLKLVDPAEIAKVEAKAEAVAKGTGTETKSETKTAEPKIGERVEFKGEKLKVGALVDGKALLYEQGRHFDYALVGNQVTEAELKANFKPVQVNIDGQMETRYLSKGDGVFQMVELGGQKMLYPDHSFEVAKTSELGAKGQEAKVQETKAPKPANERPVERETPEQKKSESPQRVETVKPVDISRLPKSGGDVNYKGEKFRVAAYEGNHALLQQEGRNRDYAVVAEPVNDADLKTKYQEVKVNIDGKESTRYIEKGHPESGVFMLTEFGGQKALYQDHSFEVVPKSDLAPKTVAEAKPEIVQPERGKEKAQAPERPVDNTPAAELKAGKTAEGNPADERVRIIDGKEVKVITGKDAVSTGMLREVQIDGKSIKLHRNYPPGQGQQWYYSERSPSAGSNFSEQVKLHVTGVSPNDLAKLQAELLPVLEDMLKKGDVKQYKTFDPNFMDGNWQNHPDKYGTAPGPEGQNSKAFTIYVPPEKAEQVAKAIDKVLKEKGLTLENFKGDNVGELTRKQSESQRVSVERDMWTLTQDKHGNDGALLDQKLAENIHEKYKALGVDSEGKLTETALRAAEKAAGIKEGQLAYDKNGRLMFNDANHRSEQHDSGRFYADESRAVKEKGSMTGRPALYALYESQGLDPAKEYTGEVKARQELLAKEQAARPERVVAKPGQVQGQESKVGYDGTIERREAKPGEILAREQLERRDRVEQKEIDAMKARAEELARSDKELDRERAEALKRTVSALEGKLGVEAKEIAHKSILAESRAQLERGEGGGYGRAIAGGLIGIGILTAAALAYYRSTQKETEQRALDRAKVR